MLADKTVPEFLYILIVFIDLVIPAGGIFFGTGRFQFLFGVFNLLSFFCNKKLVLIEQVIIG